MSNTAGKTSFMCSCGIAVNLEPYELVDWLQRHSAHYVGVEHKPQQILSADPDAVNQKLILVLDGISKRLQLENKPAGDRK